MSRKKDIASAFLGITVATILWITILSREALIGTPIRYQPFHSLISCLNEMQKGRVDANFFGNIILFIPVGFLFPIMTGNKKWYWTAGAGCSLSLLIEIIQLISARGCFDLDDVILNIIGTVTGYSLLKLVEKLTLCRRRVKNVP